MPLSKSGSANQGQASPGTYPRPVTRAACLNCRTAKRRCDGVAPVCGPCVSRAIPAGASAADGGCFFIASKRGGPRYKGVKGCDVARVRAERELGSRERKDAASAASVLVAAAAAVAAANQPTTSRSATSGDCAEVGTKVAAVAHNAHANENVAPAGIRARKRTADGGSHGHPHVDGGSASAQSDADGSVKRKTSYYGNGNGARDDAASGLQPVHQLYQPQYQQAQDPHHHHQQPPPRPRPERYASNSEPSQHYSAQFSQSPPTYASAGVTCQPPPNGALNHSHSADAGVLLPHQQRQHDLSMSNLELWQRIQAQAAAFAASNGQTYRPSAVQHHQQQGHRLASNEDANPHLAAMTPPQQHQNKDRKEQQRKQQLPKQQSQKQGQGQLHQQQKQQQQPPPPPPGSHFPPHQQELPPQPTPPPVFATTVVTDMDNWMDFNMLDTFFNQVQHLPRGVNIGAWGDGDDEHLAMELMSNSSSASDIDPVDSEQQARTLLAQYYKHVYPLLAVLLPPGHLSTYAFFFAEGRPSALLSAIAACVATCCSEEDARATIRSSIKRQQRIHVGSSRVHKNGNGAGTSDAGGQATTPSLLGPTATRAEIARYHCRTAEILLQRDRELLDSMQSCAPAAHTITHGTGPSAEHRANGNTRSPSMRASVGGTGAHTGARTDDKSSRLGPSSGKMDVELMQIEEAAARVLLAHYHYGAGPDATHRMAFDHARKAWMLSTTFELKRSTASAPAGRASGRRGEMQVDASLPGMQAAFGNADRCEWKRRVHWLAYTAATHLTCLGGFKPLKITKNRITDLDYRPYIECDDAAFGVYIRGAQTVSRAYSKIYSLDSIRVKVMRVREGKYTPAQAQAELKNLTIRRQKVLKEMLRLDAEVLNFTRFDPSWKRNEHEFSISDDPDRNLCAGLRISGKLMTSGALVMLHRTTAFGNARIFLEPQCGIPGAQALEDNFDSFFIADTIPGAACFSSSLSSAASLNQSVSSKEQDNCLWYRGSEAVDGADQQSSDEGDDDQRSPATKHGGVTTLSAPISTWNLNNRGDSGCITPDDSAQHAPRIGEENDPFADGPYDPALSYERCRFAAYTMWSTLPYVLGHFNPGRKDEEWSDAELHTAPLLPPLSCCSYVLGSYAMLMQCLFVQLYGQERTTADMLRARAWQIEKALRRFVRHWSTLSEYANEVATLLVANQSLVENKNDDGLVDLRGSALPQQGT
ncbi:hypothetical protein K437DRAFT_259211 [Tilletiaria anomala UBC 951]|uniref:Zn(2)-C6 fungal-type domain-containing protein n=1 Tax=Tilletiaria anomala (strain ATCC 24038 / CBS 436.72 / UBC 951) TaxID=1037660 RepID=A0A066VJT4_TILAU|nr:uncharacterized protein K437DRAFT_259211 [Tilletiaria anomala UBC 951]KDN39009.1 hypothetical protein K437DRAFT_259211 [Tilletiaria anomala UBC 951]